MELLKPFSSLLEPDERWANFVQIDRVTSKVMPITLNDRYQSLAKITLSKPTPDHVKSQFNVALMLGVYAWLYYPLHQLAELKAFSTLEMALRLRFPDTKRGLKRLLTLAVENGIIIDAGFSHITFDEGDPARYSKQLPEIISYLRNNLAHGSPTLHPSSTITLKNCADIINQLFKE